MTTNPDAFTRETSTPAPRWVAIDHGIREAGDDSSSSSPRPGLPSDHDLSRRRDDASARGFSDRIIEIRRDLFGDEGIPAIADALHLPQRTWMNYEGGVVMPATVLLRFLDLTGVEPHWLLTGRGPKF